MGTHTGQHSNPIEAETSLDSHLTHKINLSSNPDQDKHCLGVSCSRGCKDSQEFATSILEMSGVRKTKLQIRPSLWNPNLNPLEKRSMPRFRRPLSISDPAPRVATQPNRHPTSSRVFASERRPRRTLTGRRGSAPPLSLVSASPRITCPGVLACRPVSCRSPFAHIWCKRGSGRRQTSCKS